MATQQPRHELELQTQVPFKHCWPVWQGGPLPQAQNPLVHRSAVIVLQATHAEPLVPQAETDGAVHTFPEQQPLGHVDGPQLEQMPPRHV